MFNEATQKNYAKPFDDWYTGRRLLSDFLVQHDIASAQRVNCPKNLISAQQTCHRTTTPDEIINIAKFDNLDLRIYHVEIDGRRSPRDSVLINYEANGYIQEYRDSKIFSVESIGEPILNLLISNPDMKTKYPKEIINLRYQPDHKTPKNRSTFSRKRHRS